MARKRQPFNREKSASSKGSKPVGARQVVGIHAAREVIKVRPGAVHEVWLRKGWENSSELEEFAVWAKSRATKLVTQAPGFLDRVSPSHQGVCLVVTETPHLDWDQLDGDSGKPIILLALDGIEDPHNLGAILRTAWLMGVKAIFVPQMRSTGLSPAAMKVASGGAEHVPVEVESNLARTINILKEKGFWAYGLAAGGGKALWQAEFPQKVVWVVGSEAKGIRTPIERECDELLQIPQADPSASYNASVAAAVALAETVRQQKKP